VVGININQSVIRLVRRDEEPATQHEGPQQRREENVQLAGGLRCVGFCFLFAGEESARLAGRAGRRLNGPDLIVGLARRAC